MIRRRARTGYTWRRSRHIELSLASRGKLPNGCNLGLVCPRGGQREPRHVRLQRIRQREALLRPEPLGLLPAQLEVGLITAWPCRVSRAIA